MTHFKVIDPQTSITIPSLSDRTLSPKVKGDKNNVTSQFMAPYRGLAMAYIFLVISIPRIFWIRVRKNKRSYSGRICPHLFIYPSLSFTVGCWAVQKGWMKLNYGKGVEEQGLKSASCLEVPIQRTAFRHTRNINMKTLTYTELGCC